MAGASNFLLFWFMTTSFLLLLSLAKEPRCPSIRCGNLQDFGFPFSNQTYPECGMLIVDNCNEPVQKVQLWKHGPWYNIVKISQDNTITLVDQAFLYDFQHHSCDSFKNFAFPSSPFISFEIKYYETLFRCPRLRHSVPKNFSMVCNGNRYSIIYYNHSNDPLPILPPQCSPIQFPLLESLKESVNLQKFVTGSFTLKVRVTGECTECHYRGGACGSDRKGNFRCSDPKGNAKLLLKLGLAIVASAIGVGVLIVLAFCFREKFSLNSGVLWKKKTESYQNIEAFLRKHGHLALKRYSYSDIKKMTDSFKYKLGQGGYGDVYKGQLLDGHNVAVKVLHDTKGNGEEFINEVASISRTSHVNIVTFLGFCFEGGRRALIYEFVANGSLEKFIYEKNSSNTNQKLKWETLYRIAVGIARGLEYLHRGCSTRILHFDIKPHNILLDEDFCPKISDFGLAKICLHKQSIVSMTCARGTIGYIAPEVISRTFGEVSYKSDVYSYGMMVFEMTGGRKDENVGVNRSSETYFPHWIYKCFETDQELGLQGIENEEDREYAMKMMIVSLWCIQSNPSNRPTMSKVLEMLAGSLDSLQIPPKPF